jgi:polyhydroxyalkanoate synthase subunit PhaC
MRSHPARLVLVAAGLAACARTIPPVEEPTAQDLEVPTLDGAVIHLHRHPAAGPPVLLVHGLSANHRYWDLEPGRSMASFLAARGYDTWLLDLRGHGDAREAPGGRWLHREWNIDDYGLGDAPAAIAAIREVTGASRVAWIGHSMGGLVGAIYASQDGDDALWAYVAVGSPVDFADPEPVLRIARAGFRLGGLLLPVILTRPVAGAKTRMSGFLSSPGSIDARTERRAMRTIASPMWPGEMSQFADMIRAQSFQSSGGDVDYRAALARVRVPALVLAGRADEVAPPDRVKALYDALGSPDRRFVVAGLENGFSNDYGHMDFGVGDRAEEEIYPLVAAFLDTCAPR